MFAAYFTFSQQHEIISILPFDAIKYMVLMVLFCLTLDYSPINYSTWTFQMHFICAHVMCIGALVLLFELTAATIVVVLHFTMNQWQICWLWNPNTDLSNDALPCSHLNSRMGFSNFWIRKHLRAQLRAKLQSFTHYTINEVKVNFNVFANRRKLNRIW